MLPRLPSRRILFAGLTAACLALAAGLTVLPASAAIAAADDFVRKVGGETLDALKEPGLTAEKRQSLVRNLLTNYLDLDAVGRFCLGRYSRSLNDGQKKEYTRLFEDYLVKVYAQLLSQYNGETMTVRDGARQAGSDTLVDSQINRQDGPPIRVEWKLHEKDGKPMLTDVIVEGVSMAFTQRQQFESVIQNNGGKIDALFSAMKKQINR
jgi:phospholipid transport system substrate-binding protein